MTRFARDRRVFFVEEPTFGAPVAALDIRRCDSGVVVVTPRLPDGVDAIAEQRSLLDRLFAEEDINAPVLWYYTPMAVAYTRHLSASAVIYDCMDELSHFVGAPPELCVLERELFERADHVFTGGRSLYEHKRDHHPSVHAFPSSVDVGHFGKARALRSANADEPADQANIPHPRLGFFGVIDERMDIELIRAIADAHPGWQIVMLGPVVKIDPATLPQASNVHYLGMKSYDELPKYLAGWDVALLPFAKNDATKFISPTKTPEYLAGGCAVVSTSIRDVVAPYGELGLARIADTGAAFGEACANALADDRDELTARADVYLSQLSWDATYADMRRLVERAIRKRKAPRKHVRPVYDVVIAGAGFAGSVVAERLAEAMGKRVLICDTRPHIGGNAYDHYDDAGVLVHKYGPHIFHTSSTDVSSYLSRFTEWYQYSHRVRASVCGKLLPIPINLDTVNDLYGWKLDSQGLERYFEEIAETRDEIKTSEDVIISKVGRDLYEKFFQGYTRKQWGLDPSELDASVIARIPVRTDRNDLYFGDSFQAMPRAGYTKMFEGMLAHPNITVEVGTDYRDVIDRVSYKTLVYTGPVDAFFDYRFGKLPYRSLSFRFETHAREFVQPVAVVNYPNEHAYTRVSEFKHFTGQKHDKSTLVYEYPQADGDPYYPVPRPENHALYKRYRELAEATSGVCFTGRLATYKYYNMDQVVAQSLALVGKLAGVSRRQLLGAAAVQSA